MIQVQRMRCEATWEDKASAVLRSLREQESRGEGPGERLKDLDMAPAE
jgi:hypothetical protein